VVGVKHIEPLEELPKLDRVVIVVANPFVEWILLIALF
jgi:hypothetical protein